MKKRSLLVPLLVVLVLSACNSNKSDIADIATDSTSIAEGQEIFTQNCSACHDFRLDGIGPQLGGITGRVSAAWIREFIKNPRTIIESGDERGQKLFAQYKTVMPSFAHYTDDELDRLVAYLHTQSAPVQGATDTSGVAPLTDPVPQPISASNLVLGVEFIAEIPATSNKGMKTRITKLDFIPGSERLFMVDIRGKLYELQTNRPRVYMDYYQWKAYYHSRTVR
jgi:mono/diheme cytochrome c family protein